MSNSERPELGNEAGELPRVHVQKRALPTDVVRPTRAEVHLSSLRHNLGQLRKVAAGVPIWAVLKADAYGHGAKAVSRVMERAGVDGVCVAMVEEGVELREAGIELPILVMGGYYGDAFRELLHHHLTPVLSDPGQVQLLARAAGHAGVTSFDCHVKVDTGMARLGTRPAEWPLLSQTVRACPQLNVQGLMTHLANADVAQSGVFEEPLRLFHAAHQILKEGGARPARLHMANSGALLRDARTHFDMVRPGLALFGVDPLLSLRDTLEPNLAPISLKPSMSVVSRVVSLRQLKAGDRVGYGGNFKAKGETLVATVPMGYADGLSRALSEKGEVLVRGKRAPIIGNMSMDMTTVDLTQVPGAQLGEEVVFLGAQKGPLGQDEITATEVADRSGTIPWEVLTNISRRVPRFYREA